METRIRNPYCQVQVCSSGMFDTALALSFFTLPPSPLIMNLQSWGLMAKVFAIDHPPIQTETQRGGRGGSALCTPLPPSAIAATVEIGNNSITASRIN